MKEIIKVVDVDKGNSPFSLCIKLSDGSKGNVDFSYLIKNNKMFSQLNTVEKFRAFGLEHGTLRWENKLEIAPDWIKENMR